MNRGQIFIGTFLVLCGGVLLLTNVLHINAWVVCCPVSLIALGFALLVPGTRRSHRLDVTVYHNPDK
jgi:hypothetical protein